MEEEVCFEKGKETTDKDHTNSVYNTRIQVREMDINRMKVMNRQRYVYRLKAWWCPTWQCNSMKTKTFKTENVSCHSQPISPGPISSLPTRRTIKTQRECVSYLLVVRRPDTTAYLALQVDLGGPVSLAADWSHQDESIAVGDESLGAIMGPGEVTHLQQTRHIR